MLKLVNILRVLGLVALLLGYLLFEERTNVADARRYSQYDGVPLESPQSSDDTESTPFLEPVAPAP
jgi:hypothetical protein